jgi:hypothetical protein
LQKGIRRTGDDAVGRAHSAGEEELDRVSNVVRRQKGDVADGGHSKVERRQQRRIGGRHESHFQRFVEKHSSKWLHLHLQLPVRNFFDQKSKLLASSVVETGVDPIKLFSPFSVDARTK